MHVDGDATGLFLRDGVVWVEVAHVDARPVHIDTLGALPLLSGESPEPALTPPKETPLRTPRRMAATAQDDDRPSDVRKESPSLVAPPRQGNLWELSLATGAFVAFGTLGAGLLGSGSVAYRFEAPFVLRAGITPFGIAAPSTTTTSSGAVPNGGFAGGPTGGTSKGGAITVFGAHLLLGLDTHFVEVGLGIGGATVNQNLRNVPGAGGGTPDTGAASIVEAARIGAHDGLALTFESSAIAANGQFDLGYFVSTVQIPLSTTAMLILRGGGGRVGFAYGDVGVRVLVRGDGGKGSIALTGYAGGAAIMVDLCSTNPDPPFTSSCNSSSLGGPALGGAVEWRL